MIRLFQARNEPETVPMDSDRLVRGACWLLHGQHLLLYSGPFDGST